jgi:hypothetical protein
MTSTLPTSQQFLHAIYPLNMAYRGALLAHNLAPHYRGGNPSFHMRDCLEQLARAAAALGFELVPQAAPQTTGGSHDVAPSNIRLLSRGDTSGTPSPRTLPPVTIQETNR